MGRGSNGSAVVTERRQAASEKSHGLRSISGRCRTEERKSGLGEAFGCWKEKRTERERKVEEA